MTGSESLIAMTFFSWDHVRLNDKSKTLYFLFHKTFDHHFQLSRLRVRGSQLTGHITTWLQDQLANEKFK